MTYLRHIDGSIMLLLTVFNFAFGCANLIFSLVIDTMSQARKAVQNTEDAMTVVRALVTIVH